VSAPPKGRCTTCGKSVLLNSDDTLCGHDDETRTHCAGSFTPKAPKMCPACSDEYQRWLDYRPPATVPLVQIGTPTAALVRDVRRSAFEDRRRLIKAQQNLIAQGCALGRHARTTENA